MNRLSHPDDSSIALSAALPPARREGFAFSNEVNSSFSRLCRRVPRKTAKLKEPGQDQDFGASHQPVRKELSNFVAQLALMLIEAAAQPREKRVVVAFTRRQSLPAVQAA
ncbi:MAG TPA: hypothetical protein VJX67_06225, partial [Blastocatellia bacterium]|nr:hypothetical protein [Blastocatellia bacterium]